MKNHSVLRYVLIALLTTCLAAGCSKSESQADGDAGSASGSSASSSSTTAKTNEPASGAESGSQRPGEFANQARAADEAAKKLADMDPETVIATVDGTEITEGEITRMLQEVVKRQAGGRPVPPDQFEQFRMQARPQMIEAVIDRTLIENLAAANEIVVTDDDMKSEVDRQTELTILANDSNEEEFEKLVKENLGKTVEEYKNDTISNPDFKGYMIAKKVVDKLYPEAVEVTDDEAKERYEEQKDDRFTVPTQVRASHILFGTRDPGADKEALREEAEATLAEVKKPDADFAALAKEHSTCSSSERGGDLNFFPLKGVMDPTFANAAHSLDVGGISDVVETQFGYHIIKVTDRKEGKTRSFDEVAPVLKAELEQSKRGEKTEALVKELREKATIERT